MAYGRKTGGGSRKGKGNKDVAPIREKFQQLLDGYGIEQMTADLFAIDKPEERIKIIMGLAEYVIPKLARTEVSGVDDKNIIIEVVRRKTGLDANGRQPSEVGS